MRSRPERTSTTSWDHQAMSFRPELIAARALVAGEGNLQKGHARRCKCGFDPGRDIAIELQPSNSTSLAISKQEIMLTPNTRSVPSSRRSRCRGWSIWSSNPPNPNVGIQQNHGGASHSSVATGSKGSWNSSTEPRRLPPGTESVPIVFETTNTPTSWPGSNGSPFRTSSRAPRQ